MGMVLQSNATLDVVSFYVKFYSQGNCEEDHHMKVIKILFLHENYKKKNLTAITAK